MNCPVAGPYVTHAWNGHARPPTPSLERAHKRPLSDSSQNLAGRDASIIGVSPGDQLLDIEPVGDGVGAFSVRREADGAVVGQGG